MELKIAICDDDASQRDYLAETVLAWARQNRHLAELMPYKSAGAFLFDYEQKKDFDILLLDVEMPEMSGIELAKLIRKENRAVQIIFITGYYEYFSDGFDVSALHYLIKPVDGGKLHPVLDRAAANLRDRERAVFVSTAEGEFKVLLADILYLEAQKVYVVVHTVTGDYRTRIALSRFAALLDGTFFKVHRSYIVALKYVVKITRSEVTMVSGDTVPVSRGMYDAIHAALIKYL
ncbi:MAG: LytTR family DNA-binding domain-containing protein [Lachnospiraceae bacterium]|nr:LytTR family DNA-binding domain-containing protein [Lachnospiraceae bacterium]